MGDKISQMEDLSQEKNPLVELIDNRMNTIGLIGHGRNKRLYEMSDVPEAVISRFLKGSVNVGIANIYGILKALNLLKEAVVSEKFSLVAKIEGEVENKATRQAIADVKEIMESEHPSIVPALLANLAAFKNSVENETKLRKDVDKLKEEVKRLTDITTGPGIEANGGAQSTK